MKSALARFPVTGGHLAIRRVADGQLALEREDEDGRAIAGIFLEPHELSTLSHLADLAAIALRPKAGGEALLPHEFDLVLEAERDDGSMRWFDELVERRARGDA